MIMKMTTTLALSICGALLIGTLFTAVSQETTRQPKDLAASPVFEYACVRFMEEKTCIVWPDGSVENVLELVGKKKFPNGEYYPKGADYRMYWLTAAMNLMAKKGYEFVYLNGPDLVMKRTVSR